MSIKKLMAFIVNFAVHTRACILITLHLTTRREMIRRCGQDHHQIDEEKSRSFDSLNEFSFVDTYPVKIDTSLIAVMKIWYHSSTYVCTQISIWCVIFGFCQTVWILAAFLCGSICWNSKNWGSKMWLWYLWASSQERERGKWKRRRDRSIERACARQASH